MKQIFTFLFISLISIVSAFSQTAPDFTFTDTAGETHTLSETLAEGKVILLDFFFVNCGPCNTWAPEIDKIIEDYDGTTLEVWTISDRDNNSAIQSSAFNSTHAHHFSGGAEGGGADVVNLYASNFNFSGFPTYAVICNDGTITWDVWPISEGAMEIRAYLTEGCGVQQNVSSVAQINGLNSAKIFPNPAHINSTLEFDLETNTTMSIDLYNTLGQQVKTLSNQEYQAGNQKIELDITNLPQGLYTLKMQSSNGVNSIPLVVE